jgi:hypothetical protein
MDRLCFCLSLFFSTYKFHCKTLCIHYLYECLYNSCIASPIHTQLIHNGFQIEQLPLDYRQTQPGLISRGRGFIRRLLFIPSGMVTMGHECCATSTQRTRGGHVFPQSPRRRTIRVEPQEGDTSLLPSPSGGRQQDLGGRRSGPSGPMHMPLDAEDGSMSRRARPGHTGQESWDLLSRLGFPKSLT